MEEARPMGNRVECLRLWSSRLRFFVYSKGLETVVCWFTFFVDGGFV